MSLPAAVLRPLAPVVAAALLATILLAAWIRAQPVAMHQGLQVVLSVGVVVVVAIVLALVRRVDRDTAGS